MKFPLWTQFFLFFFFFFLRKMPRSLIPVSCGNSTFSFFKKKLSKCSQEWHIMNGPVGILPTFSSAAIFFLFYPFSLTYIDLGYIVLHFLGINVINCLCTCLFDIHLFSLAKSLIMSFVNFVYFFCCVLRIFFWYILHISTFSDVF